MQQGGNFRETFFYRGDEEIARTKSTAQGVIEQSGAIPDGKVVFVDSHTKTHGEETYRHGKKHGSAKTFYQDGKLWKEEQYRNGKLLTKKQYYKNGRTRFEVDYTDASVLGDGKEVGVGKIYYPSGVLKYEWNVTRTNPRGFKKSYNTDGTLRAAAFYDEYGNRMEK